VLPDIDIVCIFQCRNTASDLFFNNKHSLLYETFFVQVGGVLVMPLNDQLLQIVRTSETSWDVKSVLPVSFATLLLPEKTEVKDQIKLRKYVLFLAVLLLDIAGTKFYPGSLGLRTLSIILFCTVL
jgi:hypothetical protein